MKALIILSTFLTLYIVSCKNKPSEPKLLKYYVLIDGVQKTEAGLTDANTVDTIYCKDDRAALIAGLDKYYNTVVATQLREQGSQPSIPYFVVAKGWAVIDVQGENVKSRLNPAFVDSANERAVEKAKYQLENSNVQ